MNDECRLWRYSEHVANSDVIADTHGGIENEFPLPLAIQVRHRDSFENTYVIRDFGNGIRWTLHAVEGVTEQTRPRSAEGSASVRCTVSHTVRLDYSSYI